MIIGILISPPLLYSQLHGYQKQRIADFLAEKPSYHVQHSIIAIGSGGSFAQAAATALYENTELSAREIVEKSLKIAGDICIYTNQNHAFEELE